MRRGINYENGKELDKATRLMKINGCTGPYRVSADSNDRFIETYDII